MRPQESSSKPARPIVIYLDQNHVSQMAKGLIGRQVDPSERALFAYLMREVVAERWSVFSFWHIAETVGYVSDRDAMMATSHVLDSLSLGRCFRSWQDVGRDELAAFGGATSSTIDALGYRGACFPADWGPVARRASGLAVLGTRGFVELCTSILSVAGGRRLIEGYKERTAHHFREFLELHRDAAPFTLTSAWAVALGHYADLLRGGQPSLKNTTLEVLVEAELRTLAAVSRFAAETLRNMTRKVRLGDTVDVCHVAYLGYARFFLTDGYVYARSSGWSECLGARVFSDAGELHRVLLDACR